MVNGLMVKPDGKYARRLVGTLVARQNGKSHLMRMRLLWGLLVNGEQWISMAQNRSLALEQFQQACNIMESHEWLSREIKRLSRTNGKEYLELNNGGKWSVVAATRDGARGFTGNLWIDELRDVTPEAWKAATPITRAVRNAQIWITSNAGDKHSTVLNDLRTRALAGVDSSIGWFEWSANPDLGLHKDGWYQANPALGHLIDEAVIESDSHGDINAFMTESLCLWVENLVSPWSHNAFENCAVEDLQFNPDEPFAFAIDVTPDRKRADLVAGQVLPNGKIGFAIVETWISDTSIDDLAVAGDVAAWARKYNPTVIAFDKWTGANIAAKLASARLPIQDCSGSLFAQACDETLAAMDSSRLAHNNSDDLVAHFNSCAKKTMSDGGWRVVRVGMQTSISAACASIMVIHHLSKPQQTMEFFIA